MLDGACGRCLVSPNIRSRKFVRSLLPVGSILDLGAFRRARSLWTDRRTHAIAAAVRRPALQLPRPPVAAERHACARLDADDERRHQREHRQGEPQGRVSHSKRALRRASSPAALRASSSALLCAAVSSPLRLLSSASCRRCSFACCCAVPRASSSLPSNDLLAMGACDLI